MKIIFRGFHTNTRVNYLECIFIFLYDFEGKVHMAMAFLFVRFRLLRCGFLMCTNE